MQKRTNRIRNVGVFFTCLLFVSFWLQIGCAIMENTGTVSFTNLLVYLVSAIVFACCTVKEGKKAMSRRILLVIGVEAIQIIPYAIILIIRVLL